MGAAGTIENRSCHSHRAWWIALALVLIVAGCGQLVMGAGGQSYGTVFDTVPTTAECRSEKAGTCQDANRLRDRYGLDRLAAKGLTGKGVTVALLDFSGADSFAEDLEEYSSRMGLPAPRLQVRDVELGYEPFAEYDSSDPRVVSAAMRTTRQLQLIHTLAPQATILVERLRFPESERVDRPVDELLAIRLRTLVNERSADVVLLGHGIAERTLSERTEQASKMLHNRRTVFDDADRNGVTVVAPGGNRETWPAVDPGVLAVGGPPGMSRVFGRPDYQVNLSARNQHDSERRMLPDLMMTTERDERQLIYQSVSADTGWLSVPVPDAERLVGLVALSVQAAGKGLGKINDDVYYLATKINNPEYSGLRASSPEPDSVGRRVVVDANRFVRALADSARRPERNVPDERPKPEQRCQQGDPIDLGFGNQQRLEVTPRVCVRHDPSSDQLTGRVTASWERADDSSDKTVANSRRFDEFEITAVLEHSERDQKNRKCSIHSTMNAQRNGEQSCTVTITEPESGTWSADGRLSWDRDDQTGDGDSAPNLQGSPKLELG